MGCPSQWDQMGQRERRLSSRHQVNLLEYIITQNCDNLHQKAGVDASNISDVHGNLFIEYCDTCMSEYTRDYITESSHIESKRDHSCYVKCRDCGWNHFTGRRCRKGKCKGKLKDSIVNFGDNYHPVVCGGLEKAELKAKHSDVCICLGTSLSVHPASSLPLKSKNIVIVNLQDTDLEDACDVRIYSTTDDFFKVLMPLLELDTNDHSSNEEILGDGKCKRSG